MPLFFILSRYVCFKYSAPLNHDLMPVIINYTCVIAGPAAKIGLDSDVRIVNALKKYRIINGDSRPDLFSRHGRGQVDCFARIPARAWGGVISG